MYIIFLRQLYQVIFQAVIFYDSETQMINVAIISATEGVYVDLVRGIAQIIPQI